MPTAVFKKSRPKGSGPAKKAKAKPPPVSKPRIGPVGTHKGESLRRPPGVYDPTPLSRVIGAAVDALDGVLAAAEAWMAYAGPADRAAAYRAWVEAVMAARDGVSGLRDLVSRGTRF